MPSRNPFTAPPSELAHGAAIHCGLFARVVLPDGGHDTETR